MPWFAIGIENGKNSENVGTLWRSAHLLGASYIFTIGERIKRQPSDTNKAWTKIPYYQYKTFEEFYNVVPKDSNLVGIEMTNNAENLKTYKHRKNCIYLLGAEDIGLSEIAISKCTDIVIIPTIRSLNVSATGSIVMWDRISKEK